MYERKVIEYAPFSEDKKKFILVGDIGGTNSNFGVFALNDPSKLFISCHYKSKQIDLFENIVFDVISYLAQRHKITITKVVIAAAGIVSPGAELVKPTNLSFAIDKRALIQKIGLQEVTLVNDFLVIGYGLSCIDSHSIVTVQQGNPWEYAPKAIIGAGTGLGKSVLFWDRLNKQYQALPSEGGHGDCSIQYEDEWTCISYIKKHHGGKAVSWEDVLSGDGIKLIYQFFNSPDGMGLSGDGISPHPDEIFNNRNNNESCQRTVQLYTRMYARCAKNYALDTLALGGVYIAGGIAAKNIPLFQSELFLQEFLSCGKQRSLLLQIPVFVIADYNISLYGAAAYSLCAV